MVGPNVKRRALICWTTGVKIAEASAVELGIWDVLQCIPGTFDVEIIGSASNADSWQQHCIGESTSIREYGPQISETCLLFQVRKWLVNHVQANNQRLGQLRPRTVLVVDTDLTDGENQFLFAATRDKIDSMPAAISILSVTRFRAIDSTERRRKLLQRLSRHEFGHALGLVPEARQASTEEKIGLHCTNPCTMRQGMSLEEFEQLSQEEEQARILFCPECTRYLRDTWAVPAQPPSGGRP